LAANDEAGTVNLVTVATMIGDNLGNRVLCHATRTICNRDLSLTKFVSSFPIAA